MLKAYINYEYIRNFNKIQKTIASPFKFNRINPKV